MTRTTQTDKERRHAEGFFRGLLGGKAAGLTFDSPAYPAPDVWVQGAFLAEIAGAEAIGVEITEYHPAAWGSEPFPRREVDARWQDELQPAIDKARLANPSVRDAAVWFDFKDVRLPEKRHHRAIAEDLVRAVAAALPKIPRDWPVKVSFFPREALSTLPSYTPGWFFLAAEDFLVAAKHFNVICLNQGFWSWVRGPAGWQAPSAAEFGRILQTKAKKAKKYDPEGKPLWLLIVAEQLHDHESHVFPRGEGDLEYLREQIVVTGFDFAAGPFREVWLFSEFTWASMRIHPVDPVSP